MRLDVKNLLARLGSNDFAYLEFEDRFSDLELLPIFEALLKDPRLQAMANAEYPVREEAAPHAEERNDAPTSESLSALFSRYANSSHERSPQPESAHDKDVRALLRELSKLGNEGKI